MECFIFIEKLIWKEIESRDFATPSPRYGHSMTSFDNNLIVFGGMEQTDEEIVIFNYYLINICIFFIVRMTNIRDFNLHHLYFESEMEINDFGVIEVHQQIPFFHLM